MGFVPEGPHTAQDAFAAKIAAFGSTQRCSCQVGLGEGRVGHALVAQGGASLKGGVLARWASFFDHSPPVPVFAPTSRSNLEYLLTVSKDLAHPLHPVYDDGKGGGWKWWG